MDVRVQDTTRTQISWPSVFAGTFVFLAIEGTFGLLAMAIFPAHGTSAMAAGPGIWMIVLSIIALYFGARAAAHLSGGAMRKVDGFYCGLVTFGLSIFASLLVGTMFAGNTATAITTLTTTISANALWLFITLILGGIAACIGGAGAVSEGRKATVVEQPAIMRPAA